MKNDLYFEDSVELKNNYSKYGNIIYHSLNMFIVEYWHGDLVKVNYTKTDEGFIVTKEVHYNRKGD